MSTSRLFLSVVAVLLLAAALTALTPPGRMLADKASAITTALVRGLGMMGTVLRATDAAVEAKDPKLCAPIADDGQRRSCEALVTGKATDCSPIALHDGQPDVAVHWACLRRVYQVHKGPFAPAACDAIAQTDATHLIAMCRALGSQTRAACDALPHTIDGAPSKWGTVCLASLAAVTRDKDLCTEARVRGRADKLDADTLKSVLTTCPSLVW